VLYDADGKSIAATGMIERDRLAGTWRIFDEHGAVRRELDDGAPCLGDKDPLVRAATAVAIAIAKGPGAPREVVAGLREALTATGADALNLRLHVPGVTPKEIEQQTEALAPVLEQLHGAGH
jgi:hypothetical protein